ncbi:glycosyltransferase [Providencia rettgeri]|nr:glycosyltransferase [Providencia rettgeri]
MKILQLVSSFGIGGAEKFVADLSIELHKEGHEVVILALDFAVDVGKDIAYEQSLIRELSDNGIRVIHVGRYSRKRPFNVLYKLHKIIKSLDPDIVHSHLLIWSLYLSTFWRSRNHVFTQHINRLKHPFLHEYFIRSSINKYISICDDATLSMENTLPSNKILKIVNGIKMDRFNLSKPKSINKVTNFTTISRLTEQKNHDLIVDAVYELVKTNKDYKFLVNIVGDGPLRSILEAKISRLGLNDYFIFHGVRNDIPSVLSFSDVFLLPSRYEGFSIALIEALVSKTAIVASDVGANNEIISDGKYGQLIANNSRDELVRAMSKFILGEVKYSYDSDSYKDHLSKLSINHCAKNHISAYEKVINENH